MTKRLEIKKIIEINKYIKTNSVDKINEIFSSTINNDIEYNLLSESLYYAASNGYVESIKAVFEKLKTKKCHICSLLKAASANNHINTVEYLMSSQNYKKSDKGISDAFFYASKNGHEYITNMLIDHPLLDFSLNEYEDILNVSKNNYEGILKTILDSEQYKNDLKNKDRNYHLIINNINLSILSAALFNLDNVAKLLLDELSAENIIQDEKKLGNAVLNTTVFNSIEVLNVLLSYRIINPIYTSNSAAKNAFDKKHYELLSLLWKNKRVKYTLEGDYPEVYKYLITLNNISEF